MVKRGLALILFCTLFLTGCAPKQTPAPVTPDYSIPFTMAAQTAQARGTLDAGETAVAQLTQLAVYLTLPAPPATRQPAAPATQVFLPLTQNEALPSSTPYPSSTPMPALPPTRTPPPAPCYQAQVLGDTGAPFNALLPVGATFTKTWQIRNTGSCAWSEQFVLFLSGGDPMGPRNAYPISANIQPGETLNLSIGFVAPGYTGVHQGDWLLRSTSGAVFGVGINAATPLQVRIQAVQTQSSSALAYDFSNNFCRAVWESRAGTLGCPGNANDPRGSITLLDNPSIESRRADGLALLTIPNLDMNGWIRGRFPAVSIRQNDHFLSEIGCLDGSPNCSLVFQLDALTASGATNRLGTWRENYNGQTTPIDLDLSDLAGQSLQFIFSVQNTGSASFANAFWLQPRLQTQSTSGSLILSWTRIGYPAYPCAEIQVFLSASGLGQAQAFSCSPNRYELGRAGLSAGELQELLNWRLILKSFDAEINRAVSGSSLITWIKFYGSGANNAQDTDIQQINGFAAGLFDAIAP